jgi:hypothetical protein
MTNSNAPKIGRPVTTGKSPAVLVAMPPAMIKAIDAWGAQHARDFEETSRPAAIRALVTRGLKAKG